MGYGLFGKLPQKRDFVSVGLPHQVLHPFETWLQSAVAASRNEIGRNWQDYYMVAPIWNFWLGPQVMGVTCAGALMPSVDQVGRYFPLAIIYMADAGEELPPPLLDPMTDWYREIDQRLLAVLQVEGQLEIASVVAGLPLPQPSRRAEPAGDVQPVSPPATEAVLPPTSEVWAAAPHTALAEAPAVPAKTAASASPWDLPSMSADAVASIRMTPGAEVEPAANIGANADSIWEEAAAAKTDEPPGANGHDAGQNVASEPAAEASAEPMAPAIGSAEPDAVMSAAESSTAAAPASEKPIDHAKVNEEPAAAAALPPPPEPQPAAPTQPAWVAPRIHVTDFKGGLFSIVEPNRSLAEATGALIEADYRNAAMGRSFWWCETSQSGSAQMHTRQGLPDPYFFSRMLMWQAQ